MLVAAEQDPGELDAGVEQLVERGLQVRVGDPQRRRCRWPAGAEGGNQDLFAGATWRSIGGLVR